jgi:hypothetical protein
MPPRKSTASNPPEDVAEPGPSTTKAGKEKEQVGVDVRPCQTLAATENHTDSHAGPHFAEIDDRQACKRSTTSKHTNTKRRTTGHA